MTVAARSTPARPAAPADASGGGIWTEMKAAAAVHLARNTSG